VASDLPALREILGEDDAVWVPAGDAYALAQGIRTLIKEPQRAQQLGERVYARAKAFTWDARAQRIQALLQQAR
jgi:glycosyltransferase involved in cell wall biosynthesis